MAFFSFLAPRALIGGNLVCESKKAAWPGEAVDIKGIKVEVNKPDRATMRPDCVSACIEFGDIYGETDGRTDR